MSEILTEEQCEAMRLMHDQRPEQLLPRDVDRLLATIDKLREDLKFARLDAKHWLDNFNATKRTK